MLQKSLKMSELLRKDTITRETQFLASAVKTSGGVDATQKRNKRDVARDHHLLLSELF